MKIERVVLVTDDGEEDIFLFERLLKKAGVGNPIRSALSGDAAIARLSSVAEGSSDEVLLVCFLDIKMPGTNGFDVLRWVRRRQEFDSVPVIMLSSSDDPADIAKAAKLGADCYLTKHPAPAVMRDVLGAVEKFSGQPKGREKEVFDAAFNLLARRS
ncbi:MAG: response regulator [Opitutaceae bacterium]|nr:response regulator [Opitutaceae bacterium]